VRGWLRATTEPGHEAALARRRPAAPPNFPSIRSGTPLEVAELAWIGEGVSRETALSIPSVDACRNLIVGTVVQLHLYRYRGDERLEDDYLTTRPDPSTTIAATLAGTTDDLAFYGVAYWRVLDRDSEGFARRARWTPVRDVTPQTKSSGGSYAELTGYRIAGVGEVKPDDVVRFDSPIPGVLDVGGRTLAAALELEEAARRLAAVELPAGVLKNEGSELGDDEARELVESFQASRRDNGIAFLQGVDYKRENLSPADLQLVEARANVATDVARLFNVPVAMIGASPSGGASALLYSNLSQQLAILVSSAVAPYLRAIELTLSDVYPRGTAVAFDVQTFLRSDPQAAADYAIALAAAELISVDEARGMLGIPPSSTPSSDSASSTPSSDLTPGKV
jgi:HK97 family phage portal protein